MKEKTVGGNRNSVALENNFMFTTVMRNKTACIKLLEAIFGEGHRIADIRYARHPEVEKSLLADPLRRGVRLDVYFDDGRTVYDIELQRTSITDLPQRARLYSSSMDVGMLEFADFNQERPLNSTKVRVKQNNRTQPIDRLSVLRHFTIGSIGVLAKFT